MLWDWHRAAQIEIPPRVLREKAYAVCRKFDLPVHLVDVQLVEQGVADYRNRRRSLLAIRMPRQVRMHYSWQDLPAILQIGLRFQSNSLRGQSS